MKPNVTFDELNYEELPAATAYATLPPPTIGIAVATQRFLESTATSVQWLIKDVGRNSSSRGRGQFSRFRRNIVGMIGCLFAKRRQLGSVYMPISAGVTMVYNIGFALICKVRRVPVVFHHHSYSYINRRSSLMAALNKLLAAKDCQVFLSSTMQDAFDSVYRRHSRSVVLPNTYAVNLPLQTTPTFTEADGVLRIGHLSNLTIEKGLATVIEAFGCLISKGVNCELHLAGPAADDKAKELIEQAVGRFPGSIKLYGPVYGADKENFFRAINWFWFPTEYKHEAQPIVCVEALAYGVPTAAIQRGCIEWLLDKAGLVLPDKEQFLRAVTRDDMVKSVLQAQAASRTACLMRLQEIQTIEREGFEQVIGFIKNAGRE